MTSLDYFYINRICGTCKHFQEVLKENHPCFFEGEGVCTNKGWVGFGDLVSKENTCPYWEDIKED